MLRIFSIKVNKLFLLFTLCFTVAFFLRFHSLSSNPPGLYWDEAAFGYNAYSVLKTGMDEHGKGLPIFFESFGDWKLPVYFYALVPSIFIFGLNEFAIRFPSFLFGILTVFVFFLLINFQTKNKKLAVFCAAILVLSPWHVQFSRAGFETTTALFLMVTGMLLLLKGIVNKKLVFLVAASVLLSLTMYTYHAYRIFTPIFLFGFLITFFGDIKNVKKKLIVPTIVFLVMSIPLIIFTFTPNGLSRADSQSAFKSAELHEQRLHFDQRSKPPFRFLSSKIFTAPAYYSQIFIKNYLDHFSPTFLFLKGDQIGRHSQVDLGEIHIFEFALIIVALFNLKKVNPKLLKLMLLWLLIAPIPAAIVAPTPHANRSLQLVIPLVFFSGIGAYYLYIGKQNYLKIIFLIWAAATVLIYIHSLFIYYPRKFGADWQDGYRQMVKAVGVYEKNYDTVYITNISNVPYIYVLLYMNYNPLLYQETGNPDGFSKYRFVSPDAPIFGNKRALYVAPDWQNINGLLKEEIKDSNGKTIYKIWEIGGQN